MPGSYIIDGYNLIYALGMIQPDRPGRELEAARGRLLAFLARAFANENCEITVVFDAMNAPRDARREWRHRNLRVRFAPSKETADDMIEALIEAESEPRKLAVVSNDGRLQLAAQRRGAGAWSHQSLLDHVDAAQKPKPPPRTPTAEECSPEEKDHWLKEFADLENDPELKGFFDMDRFD